MRLRLGFCSKTILEPDGCYAFARAKAGSKRFIVRFPGTLSMNGKSKPGQTLPPQVQPKQPGVESVMHPRPESEARHYRAAGKLKGKVALITGGDSGIGKSVAIHFAKEGADVAIIYLEERGDAERTASLVKEEGRRSLLIQGDIGEREFCIAAVQQTFDAFGRLDILVNNAAEQHQAKNFADIAPEQFLQTFRTNIFGMFHLTQAALPHLKDGAAIVNSTSVTAFRGSAGLVDYASTKGAIVAFTRSLALQLADKAIRVNAVAPGPIWTPLIPASFDAEKVSQFGADTPMKRPGQPDEVAPCYVFLASDDASYMTGQVLHPNGGEIVA
jgi:NAD(P)-dependent dehydrogenase (short-subunit alcohol dehydrogenase family)